MKLKNKNILYILIAVVVIGLLTTAVISVSDLSVLVGKQNINQVFSLSYTKSLVNRKDVYCIQKDKGFENEANFTLMNYVEINGKEAAVYSSPEQSEPNIVVNDINAQVAYILNRKEGYGTHANPTDTQKALWHVTNSWVKTLFGEETNYNYSGNDKAEEIKLNQDAIEYAELVGDLKATGDAVQTKRDLIITDITDKDAISIIDIGDYFRVGPFKWEFEGILKNISVKGNNGYISPENLRFVKYTGSEPSEVEVSKILTGEAFYIDVNKAAGVKEITQIKLNTSSSETDEVFKVYTAQIWFFHSKYKQNVIYTRTSSGDVEPSKGEKEEEYKIPFTIDIGLLKVDDRDQEIPLSGVGFKFKAKVYRYISDGTQAQWKWVERYLTKDLSWNGENINEGQIFYTDDKGYIKIENVSGETTMKNSLKGVEVENPHYGYDTGKEYIAGTIDENKKVTNHQYRVKLSGFVWLDIHSGKTTVRNDLFDPDEEKEGVNGIPVYLRDKNGNEVSRTTTSELGLYSEIEGGEYQFIDVDLDKLQAGEYYVEFEYCGITYQSVAKKLDQNNGSKAIDDSTRKVLDDKFKTVDSTGTQNLDINGVKVNYNNTENYVSTINSHTGCEVYARTSEAGYDLYSGFKPTSEEIRYVNLGLFEKTQADYALSQDIDNVKVDVNGKSHVYKYGAVRFNRDGSVNEESAWNVGVKFQKNTGTYQRAIYTADAEYDAPNHKDNELRVYVTYKVALRNESTFLGRINSIVDYCDNRYELVKAGTNIDNTTSEISEDLRFSSKNEYNNEYSKYVINTDTVIPNGETRYIYLQFKLDRAAVLTILNNGDLLNNVAEINSYTTFKDNDVNKTLAVIDRDSVPGNMKPGQVETYEDDTDAARSLRLELKNARALVGTVFVDSTGKDGNVYSGQERLGNGIFDNGEATVAGVEVKLREIGKDDSSYDGERIEMTTTTNEQGNFEFVGYIPGDYVVTYTWGDKTYKVQYYKGTVYDEKRDQNNKYWYRDDSVDSRKTDALDNKDTRKAIDAEMVALKYNTLESEIDKAYEGGSEYIRSTKMDSTTPAMSFSVEYETTVTDGTVDQVRFTVRNVDFGIVERPKQQLEFSKRVSGFKVVLANGQILADAEITEDGKLKGNHNYLTYMGPSSTNGVHSSGFVRAEIDNELIEGATLEIIYTMKVTNVGEKDFVSDRYYYYGISDGSDLVRSSVTGLVDYVDARLTVIDDKWIEKDVQFLNDVNARQKDNETYLNSTRAYITSQLAKDLAPGESNEVTLKTSKKLTSTDDNTFENQSEIVEVTRKDRDVFNTGTPVRVTWNQDKFYFNFGNSETALIIPSTGEDRSFAIPLIVGVTSLIALSLGVFGIKKFVIDSNK